MFVCFLGLLHYQRFDLGVTISVFYEQAALAHLESIIYDPHESDPSHHGPNGVDGEDDAGVSGSDGDGTNANGEAGERD